MTLAGFQYALVNDGSGGLPLPTMVRAFPPRRDGADRCVLAGRVWRWPPRCPRYSAEDAGDLRGQLFGEPQYPVLDWHGQVPVSGAGLDD